MEEHIDQYQCWSTSKLPKTIWLRSSKEIYLIYFEAAGSERFFFPQMGSMILSQDSIAAALLAQTSSNLSTSWFVIFWFWFLSFWCCISWFGDGNRLFVSSNSLGVSFTPASKVSWTAVRALLRSAIAEFKSVVIAFLTWVDLRLYIRKRNIWSINCNIKYIYIYFFCFEIQLKYKYLNMGYSAMPCVYWM